MLQYLGDGRTSMLEADAARTFQRRIFVDTKDCSPLLEEFAPYFVIALIKNETEVDYYPSCQEYVEEYYETFKKRLNSLGYAVFLYTAYSPEERTIIKVDWSYERDWS